MAQIGQKTTYTEYVGHANPGPSPVEGFALDRNVARRVIEVDWNTRQSSVRDILGYAQVVGPGGARSIARKVPHAYPDFVDPNGNPFMFAVAVDPIEGRGVPAGGNMKGPGKTGNDSDIAQYNLAFLTIHYEAPPWDILSDDQMRQNGTVDANNNPDESSLTRYVIKEFEPSGQMIQIGRGMMRFTNDAPPDFVGQDITLYGLQVPKLVLNYNVKITHVLLPAAAVGTKFYNTNLSGANGPIDNTLGKVNEGAFPATGPFAGTFPQGSLLYVAAQITPHRSPLGLRIYNVTHYFQYVVTQKRHNFVPFTLAAGGFSWVQVSVDGFGYSDIAANNGKHIYDAIPFPPLFQPP